MDSLFAPAARTPRRPERDSNAVQVDTEIMREVNEAVRHGRSTGFFGDAGGDSAKLEPWELVKGNQNDEMHKGIVQLTKQLLLAVKRDKRFDPRIDGEERYDMAKGFSVKMTSATESNFTMVTKEIEEWVASFSDKSAMRLANVLSKRQERLLRRHKSKNKTNSARVARNQHTRKDLEIKAAQIQGELDTSRQALMKSTGDSEQANRHLEQKASTLESKTKTMKHKMANLENDNERLKDKLQTLMDERERELRGVREVDVYKPKKPPEVPAAPQAARDLYDKLRSEAPSPRQRRVKQPLSERTPSIAMRDSTVRSILSTRDRVSARRAGEFLQGNTPRPSSKAGGSPRPLFAGLEARKNRNKQSKTTPRRSKQLLPR